MANCLLIAGTDTGVGKTVLTCAIAAYYQAYYSQIGVMKLMQSGTGDREIYSQFDLDQTLDEIAPLYFKAPLAPPIAAAREGKTIDLGKVWQTFQLLQSRRDFVLIEALGGLGSPVTDELTVADIARDWRLPTVLVVPVRLGAIAQAVANVALARQSNINLKGIILNCNQPNSDETIPDFTPIELIQTLTNIPILGILPYLPDPTDKSKLTQVASNLEIEQLLPI